MHISRYLLPSVQAALSAGKMVFVGGPRQVGKTTFALDIIGDGATGRHPAYFNWDDPRSAAKLRKVELPADQPILVFDEIHKYARWRNLVKGIYDTEKTVRRIIVTGSARLDYYRKGGDSLANRYRYFRLHPLSLSELGPSTSGRELEKLIRFGGFPEPFLRKNPTEHRIWQRDRISRVVRDDLRDLEHVREVSLVEHLVDLLPPRVGSPLSMNNLAGELEVDRKTIDRWIRILENMYVCFRIPPYGSQKVRAVKKEQKLYLWDWSAVEDPGPRFENFVASALLKYCHFIEDSEGIPMELRYLRDTNRREVDFIVMKNRKPVFAVECKISDREIDSSMKYFADRTPIPLFYQVHLGNADYQNGKCRILPFERFSRLLNLP